MDKLIIGRYIVGDSFIHRLDPRSKLLAMLIYIIVIFWANNPVTYAVITLPCFKFSSIQEGMCFGPSDFLRLRKLV